MQKLVTFFCCIILLPSCLIQDYSSYFALPSINECTFSVDPLSGNPIRWARSSFPVSFYINKSVPQDAMDNFIAATNYWNLTWYEYLEDRDLEGPPLFYIVGAKSRKDFDIPPGRSPPKKEQYNVLHFTNNFGSYYKQRADKTQAVTIVRRNNDKIIDTDIVVNGFNFEFYYDYHYNEDIRLAYQNKMSLRDLASSRDFTLLELIQKKLMFFLKKFLRIFSKGSSQRDLASRRAYVPKNSVDFPSLMIHELGHVPGLFHSDDESVKAAIINAGQASTLHEYYGKNIHSVMETRLATGFSRRIIGDFDLDNLYCGYYKILNKRQRRSE